MELISINQKINTSTSSKKLVVFIFDNEKLKHRFELDLCIDFNLTYKQFISALYIFGGNKILITGDYDAFEMLKEKFENSKDYSFFVSIYSNISIEYEPIIKEYKNSLSYIDFSYGNIGKTIGIDVGGSDIKVACLIDQEIVFTKEYIWHPKNNENINYHINMINQVINESLIYLNNDVDNIKISSAGVIKDNQVLLANIYKKVKNDEYKDIYVNIVKSFESKLNKSIKYFIINDGDVSSLFGAHYYKVSNMLGLALGTSLAAGYINNNRVYDYLSEPSSIMFFENNNSTVSDYLSQDGVINLAKKYGVSMNDNLTKYEKLKYVQDLFNDNNVNAKLIFKDIAFILSDFIEFLSKFINIENVILQGRVLSNNSGRYIYECIKSKLDKEINVYLPDEMFIRIGQAICVANIVKK